MYKRQEEAIGGKGRHFELIALLALSGGLSKEDARSAIYGSGSSTENVTNVASQARKMLGTDSEMCIRDSRSSHLHRRPRRQPVGHR